MYLNKGWSSRVIGHSSKEGVVSLPKKEWSTRVQEECLSQSEAVCVSPSLVIKLPGVKYIGIVHRCSYECEEERN